MVWLLKVHINLKKSKFCEKFKIKPFYYKPMHRILGCIALQYISYGNCSTLKVFLYSFLVLLSLILFWVNINTNKQNKQYQLGAIRFGTNICPNICHQSNASPTHSQAAKHSANTSAKRSHITTHLLIFNYTLNQRRNTYFWANCEKVF